MKTETIEIVRDRWLRDNKFPDEGLYSLEISHNGWQTTSIGDLDIEDLKKLRKVIRKAIRNHENNKSV